MVRPSFLIVGRIVRPHGIRGEVIVDVRTDEPEARFTVGATLATGRGPDGPGDAADTTLRRGTPPVPTASSGGRGPAPSGRPPSGGRTVAVQGEPATPVEPGEVRWVVPPTLTIESVRAHLGRLIVSFAGVHDRNVADELRGVIVWVDGAELSPPDDPDEFHDHQLVGLTAVTPGGESLGEVARIDHAPASDLLVLRRAGGGTALVPFVKAIVPEVDLPGRRVVVDPPEGLLDL